MALVAARVRLRKAGRTELPYRRVTFPHPRLPQAASSVDPSGPFV
jgi:hypothetical protein